MGNKGTKKDMDLYCENFQKSSIRNGLDLEIIKNFLTKAISCTCKIKLDSGYGIGFFCKISIGEKKELINFLFTCNHLLPEEKLLSSKDIILEIGKKEIHLSNNTNRRKFYNSELDYSCIEILNSDKIKDFYSIDEISNNNNLKDEYYIKKSVMIIALMENGRPGLYNGIIKSIENKKIIYESNSFYGNNGGVIVNPNSNNIIGIHIGKSNYTEGNENYYLNIGNYMRYIIYDINKKIYKNIDNYSITNTNKSFNKVNTYDDISNLEYIDEECTFETPDENYKIVLGGDTSSGKTTFYKQLIEKIYDKDIASTSTCNFTQKKVKICDKKINFYIWDTCRWGGPWDSLVTLYIKNANGILLLFSLYYKNSFDNLNYCYRMIEDSLDLSNLPILLLGTHADLEKREVDFLNAIQFSKEHKFIGYFEISSVTGKNVNAAFKFLANAIYQINIKNQSLADIEFKTKLYDE